MKTIKFNTKEDVLFSKTLYKRVDHYFLKNKLQKTANKVAKIKAFALLLAYLGIFIAIFFTESLLQLYASYACLGILTIFLALNTAHDAAHHSFFAKKRLNNLLLYVFDFLGANGYIWRLKHVHSHHPHVNIPDMDEDIKQSKLIRIFPNSPFLAFHRYQHFYMPLLYLFYTLIWLFLRDFTDFFKTDFSNKNNIRHAQKEYIILFSGKIFYLLRMVILPYYLLSFCFSHILSAFIFFHFFASFTVALTLISSHLGENSVYPMPDKKGNMPLSWVRHQICTTCDFATQNKWITHLFGGFNHHLAHHLFPNICHIHYPCLTKILVQTCQEFDMPYHSNPTLIHSIKSHFKFLKMRSSEL